ELRSQLEGERAQHIELLDGYGADPYSDEVRNLDTGNDGFADSAQATEERSELLGQIDVARTRVQQIDTALEQMDEGTYGICEDCGDPIQDARLEIRPLSVKCVDCAAKAD
ncbi:MAG: TraR/DksA family transcriptional regulator, partial [Actinobacteria bacterium]|nr:TraR/DksA family transcriptional regulator [Actinomycetota bacterium]